MTLLNTQSCFKCYVFHLLVFDYKYANLNNSNVFKSFHVDLKSSVHTYKNDLMLEFCTVLINFNKTLSKNHLFLDNCLLLNKFFMIFENQTFLFLKENEVFFFSSEPLISNLKVFLPSKLKMLISN